MLIAYIFVKIYPELFRLDIREKRKVFVMLLIYCGVALFSEAARTQRNMSAMLLLVCSTAVILLYGSIFVRKRNLCLMMSGLLAAGIFF